MQEQTHEIWLWNEIRYSNEQALRGLYMECYDRLFQYGIGASGDAEQVKACINEVFASLWQKRDNLAEVENVQGYVFIYFRRVLMRQIGKTKRHRLFFSGRELRDGPPVAEAPYEEMLIAMETDEEVKRRLRKAVEQLTRRQRELIRLRFFEQMSFEDIADKTDLSLRTVYNTIHAAVSSLREAMS